MARLRRRGGRRHPRAAGAARGAACGDGGRRALDRGRLPGGLGRLEPGAAPHLPPGRRGRSGTRRSPPSCRRRARCRGCGSPGAAAGAFSTHAALAGGRGGGGGGARASSGSRRAAPQLPEAEDAPVRGRAVLAGGGRKGRAWLDLQNDVTVKDVALAARENFRSVEHMKRYTTLGMATDQGKTGGVAGAGGAGGADRARASPRPGRPPSARPTLPVPIAALGAGGAGAGFAPQRFTPAHAAIAALRGAAGRGGAVVPAELVPGAGRDRPGARPATARSRWCATRGRRLRRLDARQDRRAGAGRGAPSSTGSTPTRSRRCRSGGSATG